jgi:hypothetical protein
MASPSERVLMASLSLALAAVLSVAPAPSHPVPAYLPRDVQVGVLFADQGVVSPAIRLGWQVGLVEQPHNDLLLVGQLGTGVGLSLPAGLNALYQYVAMAGIGYSSTREVFHWGFHVVAGALWYRAAWATGVGLPFENQVMGTSEVCAEAGLKVAPNLLLGLRVGLNGGWAVRPRFPASAVVGGWELAVFVNWR